MRDWLNRHATLIVGLVTAGTILGIGLTAATESNATDALIAARQMYGLTALGFLLTATLIGPVTGVLHRLPLRGFLLVARRAVGVSAFVIAILHVLCYLAPVLRRSWREIFEPGILWTVGLTLGLLAVVDLAVLAWTSRDAAVKSLGGKRWKRLHRTVYFALPVAFLHALLVGSDFGLTRPPDVRGEPDSGSLIAFSILILLWILLAWMRKRGIHGPKTKSHR